MNLPANLATFSGSEKKLRWHWHAPFSTGLSAADRQDHAPHLGSADKEGSGSLEGSHDHEIANGIPLRNNKKFHHDFNMEHIARIEAKQLEVWGELETPEKKKRLWPDLQGPNRKLCVKKKKIKRKL